MRRLTKTFFSPPSVRLNLIVICGVVLLLSVAMGVLFYFSHKVVHDEARLNAEQTLEGTSQHLDNILFNVEQSAGNVYREVVSHLDQPERMTNYCRRAVECNPNIVGCAICMKPGYYSGSELFMTYVHRKDGGKNPDTASHLVTSDKFGSKPYTEYVWYTLPMTTGRACWTDPQPEEEDEGVTLAFCLPIYGQEGKPVGAMVVDLSVEQLSLTVLADYTLNNRYALMLGSDGSFIVHPDQKILLGQTAEHCDNPALQKVAEAMLAGETGSMSFQQDGFDWIVFYKPFLQSEVPGRAVEKLRWSIGAVYSEAEVFGSYGYLLLYVVVITVLGLLLFYLLSRIVTRRQMKHLAILTDATRRVAEGNYDDPMPDIKRDDEIGLLYKNFQGMKQALANHVNELEQLTSTLKTRREVMNEIYANEQSVDRVKTSFLHSMSNQMIAPSEDISRYAQTLCTNYHGFSPEEVSQVVDSINKKGNTIIELINNMLNAADDEAGRQAVPGNEVAGRRVNEDKEVTHD